jgi:hypothetical protein
VSGIKESQYTERVSSLNETSVPSAVKASTLVRCFKPDLPVAGAASNASFTWPHQMVNASCPRFAMLTITTDAGLGHRFQEVNKTTAIAYRMLTYTC